MIKGAAALAGFGALATGHSGKSVAKSKTIQLAFCSQLLCVTPYEVARDGGHFGEEGLDVKLVYMRGSSVAMQALVGGAVDYAATSFEDVLLAADHGVDLKRFVSTSLGGVAALAIAPNRAAEITSFKDLEGRTFGMDALGSVSQSLLFYLMRKAGADSSKVRFAVLGPNIYDAVRLGQVDAAWVGEPALSQLVKEGGRALVNFMETDDGSRFLGGRHEGMGVTVRTSEIAARHDEMLALTRALEKGLQRLQHVPAKAIAEALPRQLIAGIDTAQLTEIFEHYRASLYPLRGALDVAACERVADMLKSNHMIKPELKVEQVLDLSIAGS